MKHFVLAVVAGLSLTACQTTTSDTAGQGAAAPAWLSLVGRNLVSVDDTAVTVVLRSDGTMGGSENIEGSWQERGGKFCRTVTKPARFAGTECQNVTLSGNRATFRSPSGRTSTWTIQ